MLRLLLLLIASIGPGLLWLWYFYQQDRYEPEPLKVVFKVFLAGLLLVIPAGLLEQLWRGQILSAVHSGNWPSFLMMAFLVIALIEETLKTGFLWWLIGHNNELDEPADGIIYGITLGLGFASLENLIWASAFGFGVAALRAIITTLAHATFTGWMGYFIAKYKFRNHSSSVLLSGFFLAWASHGLYDFLLFLRNPAASLVAILMIAGLLLRLFQILQKQVTHSPFKNG
jgi:RsiW-degrading membrane proteinase PrsW (M82 family)